TQLGFASVPLLYLLTAVGACFSALDNPTRASLAPTLVDRRLIRAAMALNQTVFQFGPVFGSVVAGIVIGRLGLAGAYWPDAAPGRHGAAAGAPRARRGRALSRRDPDPPRDDVARLPRDVLRFPPGPLPVLRRARVPRRPRGPRAALRLDGRGRARRRGRVRMDRARPAA